MTQRQIIEEAYNYIVSTIIKQGKLFDLDTLYGDGSRWGNNKELFTHTYNTIKEIIKNSELIRE